VVDAAAGEDAGAQPPSTKQVLQPPSTTQVPSHRPGRSICPRLRQTPSNNQAPQPPSTPEDVGTNKFTLSFT
jgi:hypothetical protein